MVIGSRRVLRETGRTAVLTAVGEWLTWECPETGLVIDKLTGVAAFMPRPS